MCGESRLFEAGAAENDKTFLRCSLWNVAARSVGSDASEHRQVQAIGNHPIAGSTVAPCGGSPFGGTHERAHARIVKRTESVQPRTS
jgi:hypothetical protein